VRVSPLEPRRRLPVEEGAIRTLVWTERVILFAIGVLLFVGALALLVHVAMDALAADFAEGAHRAGGFAEPEVVALGFDVHRAAQDATISASSPSPARSGVRKSIR
jgi:hypothetical protein